MLDLMNHSLFLWPVLVCALLAATIAVERTFFLWFRASLDTDALLGELQRHLADHQVDAALRHCLAEPHAPAAHVAKAALLAADGTREDIELAVDAAILDAAPTLHRRIGYLSMFANVVTLFGLLGTIVGLIQSFAAVADADPQNKQTLLAEGISLAMYTTAGGISAAIPTLVWYAVLVQKGNAILDDVERVGARVTMLLTSRKRAPAEPTP
jgi:biopolymer transport protein ExbB/TolQ